MIKYISKFANQGVETLRSRQTSSMVHLNPHTSQPEAIRDTDSCIRFEPADMLNRRISHLISTRLLEYHTSELHSSVKRSSKLLHLILVGAFGPILGELDR